MLSLEPKSSVSEEFSVLYEILQIITNEFDEKNILGRGGFAVVFLGDTAKSRLKGFVVPEDWPRYVAVKVDTSKDKISAGARSEEKTAQPLALAAAAEREELRVLSRCIIALRRQRRLTPSLCLFIGTGTSTCVACWV